MFNMRNVLGLVLTERVNVELGKLTMNRAPAAVPIAGRYRLIDFTLSNMVNSGMVNVGVPTHHHYSSLMDHLGSGQEWDLDRKDNGLFILPPYSARDDMTALRGSIDVLHGVMSYLRKSIQEYVILANGIDIYSMDYTAAVNYHMENNADMTVIYRKEPFADEKELSDYTLLEIDGENMITSVEVSPHYPKTKNASMGIYIIGKPLLMSIIDECHARNEHDFLTDGFVKNVRSLRAFAYEFDGFVGRINNVRSYYATSMTLLRGDVRQELFGERPVYTKVKDEAPTKYGERATVENCLIADGCVIEGTVRDSILFRGVVVRPGATIANSIVMQDSEVGEGCDLEYVILDKETAIHDGKRLIGQMNYPVAVEKGAEI